MPSPRDNKVLTETSFLYGPNFHYIQQLSEQYRQDPQLVDQQWRQFFALLRDDHSDATPHDWLQNGDSEARHFTAQIQARAASGGVNIDEQTIKLAARDSVRAIMLIRAYRVRGHLYANLDPLGIAKRPFSSELDPATYGFGDNDRDHPIFIDNVLGLEFASVNEMLGILHRTYCSTIGVEFMHISSPEQKSWIQSRIEGHDKRINFTNEGKLAILDKLNKAEQFEKFLAVKYIGTKRFGLDGGESLVPALEQIIKRGGQLGMKEIVLGMAHRGRLNVLALVMNKPLRAIFHEFKGGSSTPDNVEGSGDVKYHLGASANREFDGNNVHLSLTSNPSHLEIVDPVVLGKVRAKQDQYNDRIERASTLPLLIHGDAAFAGQGVVAECFGLSGLRGHRTGGSIHFIVNNQIGFTTNPRFSRSSPYPSDVAKMVGAPVLHCNGDDPEAVVYCAKIATEFRQKFHKPVVVDMFCYRRHGHNEGDEPMFTQPIMYRKIKEHPTAATIYADKLIGEGVIGKDEFENKSAKWREILSDELKSSETYKPKKADWLDGRWVNIKIAAKPDSDPRRGDTGVDLATLRRIGARISELPQDFGAHRTIKKFMDIRAKTVASGVNIDWSTAEALAFGSLLLDIVEVGAV